MAKKNSPWLLARQIGAVLVALLAVLIWFNQRQAPEIKEYCLNIVAGTNYESVLSSAKSRGYSVPFYAREDDKITMFNKSGMLFEYGCTVHFNDRFVVDSTFFEK